MNDTTPTMLEASDDTKTPLRVLLIPLNGPLEFHELNSERSGLETLQKLVGGYVEAISLPPFIKDGGKATAYIHEEGKYEYPGQDGVNWRATDYMVPGIGLFHGDWIAGPMILAGFDPSTGEHAELPESVIRRARVIERESGR